MTYDTGSTASSPKFIIRNTSGGSDANWGIGNELVFTFERTASCDTVGFKEGGGVFKDKHKIDYIVGSTPRTAEDNNETVSTYNLLSASLSITDIAAINGTISNTTTPIYYTRDIQDVQGGNGEIQAYHHEILVGADIYNYEFTFNGNVISPTSSITDASTGITKLIYDIDLTQAPYNVATANEDGNGTFENGENFTFQEKFAVLGCENADIIHKSYWDCGSVCQVSGAKSGSIILGNQIPGLKLTQLEGSNDIIATNHFRVRIENTTTIAGGGAKDVYINIGLGHNDSDLTTYDENPFWAYDWRNTKSVSNVRFTGGSTTLPLFDNPSSLYPTRGSGKNISIPPNFLTVDPDGPGVGLEDLDNDGFYDDMAPGESTIIELDIDYTPRDLACAIGRQDYIGWEHLYFDVNIKDQCYVPRDVKRLDFGYKNLTSDYYHVTKMGGDTDVTAGQAFELTFNPAMYSNIELNGNNALSSNSDSEFTVTFTVPTGVTIDAANANAGLFTQSGNQITYSATNLNNYPYILSNIFTEGFAKISFTIRLCNVFWSKCSTEFTVDYVTNLKLKDASGTVRFDQDIHCGTSEPIRTHGCNGSCDGPAITKFDTYRTSAGFTDNTMTTKVDLSQAGANNYKLDNYLVGDIMRIDTEAKIQNFTTDKMYIDIKYTTDGTTLGADDILFVDGTISVFDSSSNTTTTAQALTGTPTVTSKGNDHVATFDISSFRSLFDNNLFDSNDLIYVTINYQFNTAQLESRKLHNLTNFKGEYHSVDPVSNRVSCETYGSTASYLKVTHSIGKYEEEFANCDEAVIRAWATEGADVEDVFPNEYRPPFGLETMKVTLPNGFKFMGKAAINNQQGTFTIANGDLTASQSGNVITITPTASFRNGDQRATYFPSIRVWIKGTCGAIEDGDVTFEGQYKDFHYGPSTSGTPISVTKELNYTKPSFTLQSGSSSIVNGDASEATFDINVTNTSAGDGSIDYNWIKVGDNVSVTTAFDVSTNTPVALNTITSGGTTWVEIGAIDNGAFKNIQIKATYDSCAEQTVNFAHGWDCDAYPTTQEYVNQANLCYENDVDLTLLPRNSEVQLEIIEQPVGRINMCDVFTIKLKVNSAQFAALMNPKVEFSIANSLPISAVDIMAIKVKYPYNATNGEDATYTINGDILSIDLSAHSAIQALGGALPGTNTAVTDNDRLVEVELGLSTTCDFISGTPFLFKVFADKPCGDIAEGSGSLVYSERISINGAEQPYDAFSSIVLPNDTDAAGAHIDYCGTTEEVSVFTTFSDIIGQAPTRTDTNDFGKVTIPSGVSYVEGSFASNDNITLVSSTANELVIQYPEGLVNLDKVNFTFSIISGAVGCAVDTDFTIFNYILADAVTCNGVTCVNTVVETGVSTEFLDILKPSFAGTGNTTATAIVENGIYAYRLNMSLVNNGLDATAGYTYNVYCADANGNPEGNSIFSGAISQAVPSGGIYTQTLTFDRNSICSNVVVFVIDAGENCMCETLNLPIELNANSILDASAIITKELKLCNDEPFGGEIEVTATGGSPDYQYSIDGGVTYHDSNLFVVNTAGDHTITVKDSENFTVDVTVTIDLDPTYEVLDFEIEKTDLKEYTLTATGGLEEYEYALGNTDDFGSNNVFELEESGTYTFYVKDENGCIVEKQIEHLNLDMIIPNFFTPNGDGVNDTWYPKHIDAYPNISVHIFDRYQRLITRYDGNQHSWNGIYKGKLLPSGDYWYVIKLNNLDDNREFKGNFTLYR